MTHRVLITGASSGIGAALALRHAREQAALALIGRDTGRLGAVAARCREAGADEVAVAAIDVRERAHLAAWIGEEDRRHPFDVLIVNAGITGGAAPGTTVETADDSIRILETNVLGMANTVHAALPGLLARGRGQIGIVSSIAALIPLAGLPSYCASKAANLTYALALREALRPHGIGVTAICPGYVDTPLLSQLSGSKPTRLTPDDAAERIHRAMARNARILAFPAYYAFLTRVIAMMPAALLAKLAPPVRVVTPGPG